MAVARSRELTVRVPGEAYERLLELVRVEGLTVTGFARRAVLRALELDPGPQAAVDRARFKMCLEAIVLSRAVEAEPLRQLARLALAG